MACRERETDLTGWALGELSPEREQEFEQHLATCAECARSAEGLRRVRQVLTSHLTDREMPSHLVFVGEERKATSPRASFWPSLARAVALSAAAAAVFLAIVSLGLARLRSRLLPTVAQEKPALTQIEVKALVDQGVAEQAAQERKETQAANQELAASLQQEQARSLAQFARRLQYLESAQNTVWKETQRQNQVVSLIAHSYLPAGQ